MRGPAGVAILLVAAVLATACSDAELEADPAPRSTPSVATSSAPTPTPSVPHEPEPGPVPEPVTLAFAGDVHFEGALRARLDDPATALAPYAGALAAADLAVVNLETSVGRGGRPEPGKRFTFRAPPSAFAALSAAGVDVATMANNHALDYGRGMLPTTFSAIDAADLAVVGVGRDADEAFRPAYADVDGTVVAVLGASTAALDPTADPTGAWAATATVPGVADAVRPGRLLRAVAGAGAEADVVVVYLHWGVQGQACPSSGQRSLARRLVDAGADVVVGSHAHVVQGGGPVGTGYVAYGLGNYAWYQPSDSGVLTLTVEPDGTVTDSAWQPARVGADGLPVATGERARFPRPCAT